MKGPPGLLFCFFLRGTDILATGMSIFRQQRMADDRG